MVCWQSLEWTQVSPHPFSAYLPPQCVCVCVSVHVCMHLLGGESDTNAHSFSVRLRWCWNMRRPCCYAQSFVPYSTQVAGSGGEANNFLSVGGKSISQEALARDIPFAAALVDSWPFLACHPGTVSSDGPFLWC